MSLTRSRKFRCAWDDHFGCEAVRYNPSNKSGGAQCACDCHEFLSSSCRWGAHALCDRLGCACPCGHPTNHEVVAERRRVA